MEPISVNEIVKDPLPTSFITSFVSEGWDRIGVLKDQVVSLGETFTGADKVVCIIQELLDAYLVCVGQMEGILHETEAISAQAAPVVADVKVEEIPVEPTVAVEKPVVAVPVEEPNAEKPVEVKTVPVADKKSFMVDSDFFVDFDEPDMSEPALTDDDIYPEDKEKK